jgi:pimeloyl-ACP methyl ester carboxylesterase
MRHVQTRAALLRVLDTGGNKPALVLAPDGPCVIEHFEGLVESFAEQFRVVCFDMPGAGFSFPARGYRFGLVETADAMIELLDRLSIEKAAFAFSCANGYFAMNLAKRYPWRTTHLVLAQTPSFAEMRKWTDRNIPGLLRVPFLGQAVTAAKAEFLASRWFDRALPRASKHRTGLLLPAQQALRTGGCFCLASLVQGLLRIEEDDTSGVRCPTLAIHGDSDFSHQATDFRSITGPVPHARVTRFEGCGHFPDLERADQYADTVKRFLLGTG